MNDTAALLGQFDQMPLADQLDDCIDGATVREPTADVGDAELVLSLSVLRRDLYTPYHEPILAENAGYFREQSAPVRHAQC